MDYTEFPWNSPGQNTGGGSLSLLQGLFSTQGSNPGPALQVDSLPAELSRKPTIKSFLKVLLSVGPFKDVTAFWVVIFYHKEIIYMSAIFE